MKATQKPIRIMVGFQEIILEPGQFIFGRNAASKELRMSVQTIRTNLDSLRKRQNLTIKSTNKFSIITITNWDTYQHKENETNQQTNHELTSNSPATNHKQEVKKLRSKELKDIVPSEDFETFWKQYPARGEPPKKTQKETAMKAYISATKDKSFPGLPVLLNLLVQEKRSEQWRKPKYIPMAATWLHGKPWKDEPAQTQTGSILDSFNADEWDIKHAD